MLELTEEQQLIKNDIVMWVLGNYANKSKRMLSDCKSLTGYAGTGKTTVVAEIVKAVHTALPEHHVVVAAYTGKAALVLQQKLLMAGADPMRTCVSTIHSMIYSCKGKDSAGNLIFKKGILGPQTPPLELCAMMIIDEASMLNTEITRDLTQSMPLPTLFVGDEGQLPPVVGAQTPYVRNPTHTLHTVHRQAETNPIIKLAGYARNGEKIIPGVYGKSVAVLTKQSPLYNQTISSLLEGYANIGNRERMQKTQVVLTYTNAARKSINAMARAAMFRARNLPESPQLMDNEFIVCLRNNKDVFVSNGEILTVTNYLGNISEVMQRAVCGTALDTVYEFGLLIDGVDGVDAMEYDADALKVAARIAEDYGAASALLVDYGYALTVHKSQGSEWDKVLLFGRKAERMSDSDYARWLYTGITRAKESLALVL